MTKKVNVKNMEKEMYSNYLQKADENCRLAQKAMEEKSYNAAAVCAVHSAISSVDAYCVFNLAKRCSSSNHEDAAVVIGETNLKSKSAVTKKFLSVIRMKNMAEYEERLVKQKEAEKAVNDVKELLEMVKNDLNEK